jgi:hypothetical protein
MRLVLIIILCAVASPIARAQSATDRDAVLKTVQAFFDAMTAKDIVASRTILMPQARFHAMRTRDAEMFSVSTEEYLAILQSSKQTMRERIWNPEVRIQALIATVWAPYDFWYDAKLDHCGIDAFDLIKTKEGWRIAGGTYTIEDKCEPSPLGPLKQ